MLIRITRLVCWRPVTLDDLRVPTKLVTAGEMALYRGPHGPRTFPMPAHPTSGGRSELPVQGNLPAPLAHPSVTAGLFSKHTSVLLIGLSGSYRPPFPVPGPSVTVLPTQYVIPAYLMQGKNNAPRIFFA
jgi:hypothetical protein